MSLKAKIEAIIYAAEEPITLEQISSLVKDIVLAEQAQEAAQAADAAGTTPEAAEGEIPSTMEIITEPAADETASASATEGEAAAEGDAAVSAESAAVEAPDTTAAKVEKKPKKELSEDAKIRAYVRKVIEELITDYETAQRGMEIRPVAGGYRMTTRPEHHDVVRAFAKSLKPPVRLSMAALETLAVIAYKQPVTVPEISEIRGVESGGVIGTLLDRKLITTGGRKQVVGRPILYKTSKDFLMRFGLNDVNELPSMEEFEKIASDGQGDLFSPREGDPPSDEAEKLSSDAAETVTAQADGAGDSADEAVAAEDVASEKQVANDDASGVESNDHAESKS